MGYDDRGSWGSESGGFGEAGRRFRGVLAFLNSSFPVGRIAGIAVRVHIIFVIVAALRMLGALGEGHALWTLRWISLLFVSVLLHELGHCFGCRATGGRADRILMWPLGGLAFLSPPRRPWPEFVTVVCGPLVNLVICVASLAWLTASTGWANVPVSLDPFTMWVGPPEGLVNGFLADLFVVNYALLLFNLAMLFYPFDGGRLVQTAIWAASDYPTSMWWALRIGVAGAGVVLVVGVLQAELLLAAIAVFGFLVCWEQLRSPAGESRLGGALGMEAEDEPWRASLKDDADELRERSPSWLERRRARRAAKRRKREAEAEAQLQSEVDRILEKVKQHGMHSLEPGERRTLQRATQKQRGGA
jgi:Zn-dependent protease